jgi:hypothetical protein
MTENGITDTILQLSNNAPIVSDILGGIDGCSIFGRLYEYKMLVLRNVIEQIENRPSKDEDWRHIIIAQKQGGDALMTSSEEVYYKQKHVGTITFRMENFTAHFDFIPAQNNETGKDF